MTNTITEFNIIKWYNSKTSHYCIDFVGKSGEACIVSASCEPAKQDKYVFCVSANLAEKIYDTMYNVLALDRRIKHPVRITNLGIKSEGGILVGQFNIVKKEI